MALKLIFIKSCGYETYKSKEVEREQKKNLKRLNQGGWRGRGRGSTSCHYSCKQDFALSFLQCSGGVNQKSVYWKIKRILCAQNYTSDNFIGAIFDYKVVSDCEKNGYEDFSCEILEALLSEPFLFKRMIKLSRRDGFTQCSQWGLTFSLFLNCQIQLWKLG